MAKPASPDQIRAAYLRALESGSSHDGAVAAANRFAHTKAEAARPSNPVPKPPQSLVARVVPKDETAALRAEYERVVGRKPYMGWDAEKLRAKIAEAKAQ